MSFVPAASPTRLKPFTPSNPEAGSLFFGLVSAGRWEGRAGLPLAVVFILAGGWRLPW